MKNIASANHDNQLQRLICTSMHLYIHSRFAHAIGPFCCDNVSLNGKALSGVDEDVGVCDGVLVAVGV